MYILITFLLIVAIKFVLNFSRLVGTCIMHVIFLSKPKNLVQYCPFVTSLFNSAGTQQAILSTTRSNGMKQAKYDYISNSLDREDTRNALESIFQKTIGVYKFRMFQTINPFYWLFLPKYILEELNISISRIGNTFLSFTYWVIGFAGAYFLEKYLDARFQDFFQKIIDMLP